jgi:hypothetical protein
VTFLAGFSSTTARITVSADFGADFDADFGADFALADRLLFFGPFAADFPALFAPLAFDVFVMAVILPYGWPE